MGFTVSGWSIERGREGREKYLHRPIARYVWLVYAFVSHTLNYAGFTVAWAFISGSPYAALERFVMRHFSLEMYVAFTVLYLAVLMGLAVLQSWAAVLNLRKKDFDLDRITIALGLSLSSFLIAVAYLLDALE